MRPAHDLSDLVKWLTREEWRSHLEEVMEEHFGPTMEAFGLEFGEIDEALGGSWGMTLWGCAFEDFLTRRFGPGEQNPVEAYLRRRGWKERVAARSYMMALQTSVMSLYEVSDLIPGQSFRARDLIRGGDPVLVSEHTATRTLKLWDRIAARIVPQGEKMILAGGVLAFTLEGSQTLIAQLRDRRTKNGRRSKPSRGAPGGRTAADQKLRRAAPLFTTTWLFDVLPRALGINQPILHNGDGDEIVFHTVTFPLAPGIAREEVLRRLSPLPQLHQENPTFWNWLGGAASGRAAANSEGALVWNVTMQDGTVVLGNVELKERGVALSVNSAARADRGRAMLAAALAGLVGTPLTEIQTVEQMKAARPAKTAHPPRISPLRCRLSSCTPCSTSNIRLCSMNRSACWATSHPARLRAALVDAKR
ncbi:MAG: hypothetical protein JOY71_25890 [Acetobacteraceae bacterium]|nr:hypothetical protein [Acetobacteraceae bacterium]MBV8525514.1 hypothetical protein [Acetobacteraceae bacterium]